MTLFEQVLNLHQNTIALMSTLPESLTEEAREKQFIAQALIAMGDDELRPDEMLVRVTRKHWKSSWAQIGSVYKVFKEPLEDMYRLVNIEYYSIKVANCEVIQ